MGPRLRPATGRRFALFGFALLAAAYVGLVFANPMRSNVHGDGYYNYLWARTLVVDGDLDFHDDYRVCPDPWSLARTPIGEDLNYWNMGPALFWGPILAFDRAFHPAAASPVPAVATACTPPLSERAVYGSFVAGLLTLLVGFLFARRHVGDAPAMVGVAGVGLLTALAYYSTMLLSYGHAASSFAAGLLILAWDHHRRRPAPRGWALMGGALGLAMLMRSQNAILVVLPFGLWVGAALRFGRAGDRLGLLRHVGLGFLFTGVLLLVFFPQLLFLRLSTGSWFTVSQGEHYMRWGGSMAHKALFSANGLVPWAPIHLPALLGLVLACLRGSTRAVALPLLGLSLLDAYVVGAVYDWWGSIGYPGRRFDMLAVVFMFGLGAFARELARWAQRRRGRMAGALLVAAGLPLAFWSASVHVGVAGALRTDVPAPAPEHWRATYGQLLTPMWRAVGNPLTWPASLPFALRYGTHPRRWDMVGGHELFYHDHQTLEDRPAESRIDFRAPAHALYADGRVESAPSPEAGGLVAYPGTSRIFVPLHWPHAGRLELRLHTLRDTQPAQVALHLRRYPLGLREVPSGSPQRLLFDVPVGLPRQGINELWLWVGRAPVVLERLEVMDPIPPPEDAQRERNRAVREERERLLSRP